jgi:hypothetical protein
MTLTQSPALATLWCQAVLLVECKEYLIVMSLKM